MLKGLKKEVGGGSYLAQQKENIVSRHKENENLVWEEDTNMPK